MKGVIVVALHKEYEIPADPVYLPVCVGSSCDELRDMYQPDDVGDNISERNGSFNELTAVYWAWKNLKGMEYVGLAHYRRHFTLKRHSNSIEDAITGEQIDRLFERYGSGIFTVPAHWYPHTIERHYCRGSVHARPNDIAVLRQAVHELQPDFSPALEKVLCSHHAHMRNMSIMPWDLFDRYCSWLFPILFEVDAVCGRSRMAGAIAEWMLDVWASTEGHRIIELGMVELEPRRLWKRLTEYLALMRRSGE